MAKLVPTNMKLELREHSDAVVSCEVYDFRYHVWLDNESLAPRDGVLFKNPVGPANLKTRTIRLNIDSGFGAQLWPLMKAALPGLVEAARSELKASIEQRDREAQEQRRVYLAKQAGPALLAAARKVLILRDPKAKLPGDWSSDSVYAELAQAVAMAEGQG